MISGVRGTAICHAPYAGAMQLHWFEASRGSYVHFACLDAFVFARALQCLVHANRLVVLRMSICGSLCGDVGVAHSARLKWALSAV